MAPASTSSTGGHALATLLGNHGVEVVVADSIADVEAAARPTRCCWWRRRSI